MVRTVAQVTGFEPGPTAERRFTVTGGNGTDCQVPDVIGMSVDDATAAVEANGLRAARQDVESGAASPGTVVGQDPDPDAVVSCTTPVTLWVSKGLQ